MSRPSLFRWLVRWAIGSVVCLFLIALVMVVVNAIDYAPYGLALRRANKLKVADLETLAAACARYEKGGHQRLFGDAIPVDFRALKPVRVSIYPGSSDISLLEHGDDRYVFLRVSTSPENQLIKLVSYGGQRQRGQIIWERNPDLTHRLNPSGRIVTVSQWDMHSGREWIVLPTRLLVVDRASTVGGSDQITADVALNAGQRGAIESAIRGLGTEVRGHAFDSGAMDGIGLRVSFSSDGSPNPSTDIVLENTRREEVEPLMQAISNVTDKQHAISFADFVRQMDEMMVGPPAMPVTVLPLEEFDRRRNQGRLAWWCWWPRLRIAAD